MIAADLATGDVRTSGKHNHWMQNRPGWCFLILTRSGRDWEKTLGLKQVAAKPESTGTEGTCEGRSVKFGKGLEHKANRPYTSRQSGNTLEGSVRRFFVLIWLVLLFTSGASAQQTIFEDVKIHRHRSASKRVLVDKIGTLTFDDVARKIIFMGSVNDHIEVGYEEVAKVVFDVTTRMRGGALAQFVEVAPIAGPMVGSAVAAGHVSDYWFYLEYKDGDHTGSALLVIPKHLSERVIAKASTVFGSRATVTDLPERGSPIKKEDLKALKSKHVLRVDKQNHPLPEVKPDKATIVVVCPPLAARYAGKGNQFKLHANDQVVAVNRMGTYSLAYLDPGRYRLASQTENANGFEMELESGHEYFFLQNTFAGVFKAETALSRNSREVVMYLLDGSDFADWKTKEQ